MSQLSEHAVDWVKIKRGVKSRWCTVAEARENTATNNNKQANKKQLNYTFARNSTNFLSKFVHVIIQLFSANLLSGLAILAFFVWLAERKLRSANHTTPALQASEATPQWTVTQLANKLWKNHNATHPQLARRRAAAPLVAVISSCLHAIVIRHHIRIVIHSTPP